MNSGKAPGPDGITADLINVLVSLCPEYVLKTMNKLLSSGTFPDMWKTAALVLIEKPKKSLQSIPTYRSICLINSLRKLLED